MGVQLFTGTMNGHANGESNGHSKSHSSSSKHKHKDKERERRKETEEERKIRKQKEKEKLKNETEDQRKERKERERKERDDKYRKEGKRPETEEERKIRKEKERKEREDRAKKEGKRLETDEERRIRKEKEKNRDRKDGKRSETEEERRIRKEKERKDRDKSEKDGRRKETEEERRERKERERRERKEKEERQVKVEVKEEPMEAETSAHDEESAQESAMEQDVKEEPDETYQEEEEEEEKPLKRKRKSYKEEDDDEDFQAEQSEDDEDDFKASKKKAKANKAKKQQQVKREVPTPTQSPTKKKGVKKEDEKEVWKWWEEKDKKPEGVKWFFLEHNGPLFAPLYEPLPDHVKFYYDGKKMRLSEPTEECATFYGRMLDHDYTTKEVFNKNFMKDWRKVMTDKEKEIIRDLSKCDFSEIDAHFKKYTEERKNRSKEEKDKEKAANAALIEEYVFCTMDGHKEKIGNFRTEPPSLFRGRGEHPKQGMIKRRIQPEDVIINCSKDSKIPKPPEGHKWKKVQHDNTVTWLASWTENIQGQIKYIMLNPSSRLKGEKDWQKYEKARKLKGEIEKIREDYMADMKSKEMRVRQRAVALYFIDKLALRAGNEKDGDEQADTVGCCSLRVEHIELHEQKDGKEYVVEFDFLGKDSIRYNNEVPVDKRVFKNVKLFMENKKDGDDLFDRLNTSVLNQYLNGLMDGLTAKVFRTFNASFTLQQQLDDLTDKDDNLAAKMLSYNRANRAVAILCNHQRAVPKTHDKAMENLDQKLEAKAEAIKTAESGGDKGDYEKKKKAVQKLLEQMEKLEIQKTDKHENKTIALGTSKLNYLDPRISVQWCKTHEVPIEKVYTKTHREKFRWAIDMIMNDDEVFHF